MTDVDKVSSPETVLYGHDSSHSDTGTRLNLCIDFCTDQICDLLSACSRFTVIAAFDKCVYLKPLDGDQQCGHRTLICLCQPELGKGPINCIIAANQPGTNAQNEQCADSQDFFTAFFTALARGQTFFNDRQAHCLHLQASAQRYPTIEISVEYAAAFVTRLQTAAIPITSSLCSIQDASATLGKLESVCHVDGLRTSIFHDTLLSLRNHAAHQCVSSVAGSSDRSIAGVMADSVKHLTAQLQVLLDDLISATSHTEVGHFEKLSAAGAEKLLGVGVGLTPAGDDFLCGVMAALYSYRRVDVAAKLWSLIEPQVDLATHLISACHLEQAAKGQVTDASLKIMASLEHVLLHTAETSSEQKTNLTVLQSCCEQVGSSSGYDFLAGLLFVRLVFVAESTESP